MSTDAASPTPPSSLDQHGYPAELYAAVHTGTPGDVPFYAKACEGAKSVLELGCGDARVLCSLLDTDPTREGVGLELHPGLLALARRRAAEEVPEAALDFLEADMREFSLGRRFERIIMPHGSLYCLLEPADLDRCLEQVVAHLAPDGELWLDAYAADGFHETATPGDMAEDLLGEVKEVEVLEERYRVSERSSWDPERQRIDSIYVHTPVHGGDPIEGHLPQRYVLAEQLLEALLRHGLEPIALFGGFDASPYDPELAETMIVGARLAPADQPDT